MWLSEIFYAVVIPSAKKYWKCIINPLKKISAHWKCISKWIVRTWYIMHDNIFKYILFLSTLIVSILVFVFLFFWTLKINFKNVNKPKGFLYCYIKGGKSASVLDLYYMFALQIYFSRSWFNLKYNIFRYMNARYISHSSLHNIPNRDFVETIFSWTFLEEFHWFYISQNNLTTLLNFYHIWIYSDACVCNVFNNVYCHCFSKQRNRRGKWVPWFISGERLV